MEEFALTGAGGMDVVISPSAAAQINSTMTQPRGSTVLGLTAAVGPPIAATQAVEYGASDAAKKKQMNDLKTELELLRAKLTRRNGLMKDLIKAYHHDIITIKEELCRKETVAPDKVYVASTEVADHIPSVDLRDFLKLFAPSECYVRVKPCDSCGGTIDIVHHESERVIALEKVCAELQDRTHDSEELISSYRDEAARDRKVLEQEKFRMELDRKIFEDRVLELKAELTKYDPKEISQLRRDVVLYRGQTKDLSIKLKSMASLEAELRKTSAAYETLQNSMADKDKMLRDIERDKCTTEELAASLGRKCESLEQEVEKSTAAVQEMQRKTKAATEQATQLKEANTKLQKANQEHRRAEQAAKQRIIEMDVQHKDLAKQNDDLQKQVRRLEAGSEAFADATKRRSMTGTVQGTPIIQVYAASTDEFGDAVELTSLLTQKADLSSLPPGTGPLAMTGGRPAAEGQERPSSQVFVVSLPDAVARSSMKLSSSQKGVAFSGSIASQLSSSSSSAASSPSHSPRRMGDTGTRRSDHGGSSVSGATLTTLGSTSRSRGGNTELWIEVSSSDSSDGSVGGHQSGVIRQMSISGTTHKLLQAQLEEATELVNKLEAELIEERETRMLVEKGFIRATALRFFNPNVEAEFFGVSDMTVAPRLDDDPSGNAHQIHNLRATSNGVVERPSDQAAATKKGTVSHGGAPGQLAPLPENDDDALADTIPPAQGEGASTQTLPTADGVPSAEAVNSAAATTAGNVVAASPANSSAKAACSAVATSPTAAHTLPSSVASPRSATQTVVLSPAQMREEFVQLVKDVFERQRAANVGFVNALATGAVTGMANGFATGLAARLTTGLAPGVAPGVTPGVTPGVAAERPAEGSVEGPTQGPTQEAAQGASGEAPEGAPGTAPGLTSVLAPGMTSMLTPGMASMLAPGMASVLAPGLTSMLTPGMASMLAPGLASMLAPGMASGAVAGLTTATGLASELATGLATGMIPGMTLGLRPGEPLTEDVQRVVIENMQLVAKLVRAVREKDQAQEALAQLKITVHEIEAGGTPSANANLRGSTARSTGGKPDKPGQAHIEAMKMERSSNAGTNHRMMELRMQLEDRIKHLEEKVLKAKVSLTEERAMAHRIAKELEEEKVVHQNTGERCSREEAKVATLREGLKDQLDRISQLEVQKNELSLELNFKLARKGEEVEAKEKEIEKEVTRREQVKAAAAELMTTLFRVCKSMEEALEKRVSPSELKDIDSKIMMDPGTKQVARRFDKKDVLREDEMPLMLNAAKVLNNPLTYLATRALWSTQNLRNEVDAHKALRKTMALTIEADARAVAKHERKVKELLEALEQLKDSSARKLEAKDQDISDLRCNIMAMLQKEADLEAEVERLRVVEASCDQLKADKEDTEVKKDAMNMQLQQIRSQVSEFKVKCDSLAKNLEDGQAKLAHSVGQFQGVSNVLLNTKETLAETQAKLEAAQRVIKHEEIRRSLSKAVGTQFNPEVTDSEVQTQFLVPDLGLRHTMSLEDPRRGKLFIERVVTPGLCGDVVPRRCATSLSSTGSGSGKGGVIVTVGRSGAREDEDPVWRELETMGVKTPLKHFIPGVARLASTTQPVGSLRGDMREFMRPLTAAAPAGDWALGGSNLNGNGNFNVNNNRGPPPRLRTGKGVGGAQHSMVRMRSLSPIEFV